MGFSRNLDFTRWNRHLRVSPYVPNVTFVTKMIFAYSWVLSNFKMLGAFHRVRFFPPHRFSQLRFKFAFSTFYPYPLVFSGYSGLSVVERKVPMTILFGLVKGSKPTERRVEVEELSHFLESFIFSFAKHG